MIEMKPLNQKTQPAPLEKVPNIQFQLPVEKVQVDFNSVRTAWSGFKAFFLAPSHFAVLKYGKSALTLVAFLVEHNAIEKLNGALAKLETLPKEGWLLATHYRETDAYRNLCRFECASEAWLNELKRFANDKNFSVNHGAIPSSFLQSLEELNQMIQSRTLAVLLRLAEFKIEHNVAGEDIVALCNEIETAMGRVDLDTKGVKAVYAVLRNLDALQHQSQLRAMQTTLNEETKRLHDLETESIQKTLRSGIDWHLTKKLSTKKTAGMYSEARMIGLENERALEGQLEKKNQESRRLRQDLAHLKGRLVEYKRLLACKEKGVSPDVLCDHRGEEIKGAYKIVVEQMTGHKFFKNLTEHAKPYVPGLGKLMGYQNYPADNNNPACFTSYHV